MDLPVGSMASPEVETALERKVIASLTRTMGEARAREAFSAGLDVESIELADFIDVSRAPRSSPREGRSATRPRP